MNKSDHILEGARSIRPELQTLLGSDADAVDRQLAELLAQVPSRMRLLLPLLLLLFLSRTCFADSPVRPRDEAAIQQVIQAYENAWNRHDAHEFSLIFAPNAEFVNVRGIAYPGGRVGIERAHRPLFATMFKNSHVMTDQVRIRAVRPDVATVDVYWRMTGSTDRAGRPRGLVRGLRNMVLTREGRIWGIAVFHNMEIAAPAGKGTPSEKSVGRSIAIVNGERIRS